MLIMHIRKISEESLAHRMYQEQMDNAWPGLAQESQKICDQLKIESVHTTGLEVKQFRKVVTEACHKLNEQRLRKKAGEGKKAKRIISEAYLRKEYIGKKKIENVRIQFRARYGMLPFAGNYGHDRKFAHSEWLCSCREQREEESHLLAGSCRVYGDIRERYDNLEDDEDLVRFFSEVLERREELEARGLEDEALAVETCTADDASLGYTPGHAIIIYLTSRNLFCHHPIKVTIARSI